VQVHDDDDQGTDEGEDAAQQDAQLADDFDAYADRTADYAATASLTPEKRRRVLRISTADLQEAFDLDGTTVRRVKRLIRGRKGRPTRNGGSGSSTPLQNVTNSVSGRLRVVAMQRVSEGVRRPSSRRGNRIVGVAPGPRGAL
jgi:hypothetical protein